MTELELIEGCRREDNSSRRKLYEIYSRQMMGICYRYTGDKSTSQDLLHDGFIKVFESVGFFRYQGEGSFRAWISRLFTNMTLDYLRKNNRWNEFIPLEEWHENNNTIIEEDHFEPVSNDVLIQFVSELPVGYRTVFNLYTFEEMSHKEIARAMGINESSSRSQLSRAKAILSEKIKKYALDHG